VANEVEGEGVGCILVLVVDVDLDLVLLLLSKTSRPFRRGTCLSSAPLRKYTVVSSCVPIFRLRDDGQT
jgi:hypothetical protein